MYPILLTLPNQLKTFFLHVLLNLLSGHSYTQKRYTKLCGNCLQMLNLLSQIFLYLFIWQLVKMSTAMQQFLLRVNLLMKRSGMFQTLGKILKVTILSRNVGFMQWFGVCGSCVST